WKLSCFAGTQKRGQWQRTFSNLFQYHAQTGGNAGGNKSVIVAPKINPGFCLGRDFVEKSFADFESAIAKTFFRDRIDCGITRALTWFAFRPDLRKLLARCGKNLLALIRLGCL